MAGLVPLSKRFGGMPLKTRQALVQTGPGGVGARPSTYLADDRKDVDDRERRQAWVVCARRIAELLCPDMTKGGVAAAPHRRHHHLVAPAGAAVDFLAGAELHVL